MANEDAPALCEQCGHDEGAHRFVGYGD
ncbi:MAG: hypothetical protein JWO56_2189, partial [Acidobacteria bacterium]|nr:hypothetical protein [Acidobacteriota bacterium]